MWKIHPINNVIAWDTSVFGCGESHEVAIWSEIWVRNFEVEFNFTAPHCKDFYQAIETKPVPIIANGVVFGSFQMHNNVIAWDTSVFGCGDESHEVAIWSEIWVRNFEV